MSAQSKLKHGAMWNVRGDGQLAFVCLDDRAADGQSHPHAIGFRREERVEYAVDILRADPCPAIGN